VPAIRAAGASGRRPDAEGLPPPGVPPRPNSGTAGSAPCAASPAAGASGRRPDAEGLPPPHRGCLSPWGDKAFDLVAWRHVQRRSDNIGGIDLRRPSRVPLSLPSELPKPGSGSDRRLDYLIRAKAQRRRWSAGLLRSGPYPPCRARSGTS